MPEKSSYQKLKNLNTNLTWVNINNPTEKEIAHLKRTYRFHHLDLEDCLSNQERPKIDDYDEYLFIVLHVPIKKTVKGTRQIKISEINIFISQNYVITLHDDNPIITHIFQKCKKSKKVKDDYMKSSSGYFLYMIIDDFFESGFPILDDLSKQMNELEVDVFDPQNSRDRLKEILLLKKDIINFRRIIMPQRAIIAQLEHKNKKFLPENLDVYFDDIVDKIEKIWNNLENLQELVASIQETNESIISHNTNNVIKILTVFSVVMLPLTFITGFYGMNVKNLPYADNPMSTTIVSLIIMAVALIMVGFFRYKRWI